MSAVVQSPILRSLVPIQPDSRTIRLVTPVVMAGFATAVLFAAIDRTQPWSLLSAALGVALLALVLMRQLGEILQLERQVALQQQKLSTVSEVVAGLNSGNSVGSSLGGALDKVLQVLECEAGAIWLPVSDHAESLSLVEQRGFVEDADLEALLTEVESRDSWGGQPVREHETGPLEARGLCLSVRLGDSKECLGYLTVCKRNGGFSPVDRAILHAVGTDIGASLRSVRMISEARRLADRDPVTSLYNHRSAYQRLRAEVERSTQAERPLAVLMMDLDNFKLFNDTYGHPAGDDVLKRVSNVLRRSCREGDVVARYGGDEFLVVLPETSLSGAIRCAERIQANMARERFRCEDSHAIPIGFSYGIASFPEDGRDVQELVSVADANLYESKTEGGNRITARGGKRQESGFAYLKGFDLFRAMVSAIDNKDGYTRRHSEEVTAISIELARALGMEEPAIRTLRLAGLLHDVGKIGVPDAILRKPGTLTEEELAIMRQHPVFGALIVGSLPGMEEVVKGVRYHHERWDGLGYPDRLKGEQIPLIGRIMAVADAYSAMTTSRPYRRALTHEQALGEIRAGLGTQFDPEVGALFIRLKENAPVPAKSRSRRRTAPEAEAARPDFGLLPTPA